MEIRNRVVLVTGGAQGIGRAMVERFAAEGARGIGVADLDGPGARKVADAVGGVGLAVDVTREADIQRAVAETEARFGPIDLLCSNAGVVYSDAPGWTAVSQTDEQWNRSWNVHVMAHMWAARAVLPGMIERGGGYLLNTVSAAGLLGLIGDTAYTAAKHAAIGFAEAVAINHGDQGIGVSVLCPQAVATQMIEHDHEQAVRAATADGILQPAEVADAAVRGLAEERFLILPHPEVQMYVEHRASDHDRWLAGMRKFRRTLYADDSHMSFARPRQEATEEQP